MSNFEIFVDTLVSLIGTENVVTSGDLFNQFSTSTMKEQNKPLGILLPTSAKIVEQIVQAFNKNNFENIDTRYQLHPVGSGKNWGYTSSEPGASNTFILCLSKLNKIKDYDRELGTIRIEAGVTQKELFNFLTVENADHWMDATGSSEDCSVLANSLERGFGHTPAGNHFEFISDFDIILGNGKLISTGFRQFATSDKSYHSEGIYKWGVGPYADGLFSQSNFGVVVSATLKLMPAPDEYLPFFISTKNTKMLPELIDALRGLRNRSVIKSCVHITNLDKALQAAIDETDWPPPGKALSAKLRQQYTREYMLSEWTASGALYGSREEIDVWKKMIRRAFNTNQFNVKFISEKQFKTLRKIAPVAAKLSGTKIDRTLEKLNSLMKLKRGEPTNDFLKSVHYKVKNLPTDDDYTLLERNSVGLIWLAPTAPATGQHAEKLTQIVSSTLAEFNVESAISITLLSSTAIECIVSLLYDRSQKDSDHLAEKCHNMLLKKLLDEGYLTYRFNSFQHRDYAEYFSSELVNHLKEVNSSLDPNSVLCGGRYGM